MKNGLIAVIGSADEKRTYDPPVDNHAGARRTAEKLGKALGESDFRIVVYSVRSSFIEVDTVRGFVQAKNAKRGSIVLEMPLGQKGADGFLEYATHSYVFQEHQDASKSWEVSFYHSLSRSDGVVLIGGANSTLVAGMVALTQGIPLVASRAEIRWNHHSFGAPGIHRELDARALRLEPRLDGAPVGEAQEVGPQLLGVSFKETGVAVTNVAPTASRIAFRCGSSCATTRRSWSTASRKSSNCATSGEIPG